MLFITWIDWINQTNIMSCCCCIIIIIIIIIKIVNPWLTCSFSGPQMITDDGHHHLLHHYYYYYYIWRQKTQTVSSVRTFLFVSFKFKKAMIELLNFIHTDKDSAFQCQRNYLSTQKELHIQVAVLTGITKGRYFCWRRWQEGEYFVQESSGSFEKADGELLF